MPMKSQAQRRYLWAKKPELAKEFEAETPKGKKLPKKAKKPKFKPISKKKKSKSRGLWGTNA